MKWKKPKKDFTKAEVSYSVLPTTLKFMKYSASQAIRNLTSELRYF